MASVADSNEFADKFEEFNGQEEERILEESSSIVLENLTTRERPKPVRSGAKYKDFETVDWLEYNVQERHRLDSLRQLKGWKGRLRRWWSEVEPWLLVALIGFSIGSIAASIDIWHYWLVDLRLGYCKVGWAFNLDFCCWTSDEEACPEWHFWSGAGAHGAEGNFWLGYGAYLGFASSFGLIAALIVKYYAAFAAGSGIPEVKVIISGFIFHRYLGLRTLFFKVIALTVAVSTGLNLGKEGPMIHLAACCANVWTNIFRRFRSNEATKREIIASSAAAGIAAAFGAPIGGVLFAYEEAAVNFPTKTMMRSLVSATLAALALKMIDPFRTGRIVEFVADYDASQTWRFFEFINFIVLGVVGGLSGSFFIAFNMRVNRLRKRTFLSKWPVTEVVAIVILTGLLQYPMPISRQENVWPLVGQLFATYAMKLLLMTITIGLKVPAGLFIPSLALGSCLGRAVGIAAEEIIRCPSGGFCINAAFYAVAGAFAVLTGVTRATISLVVIAVELTGAVQYLLPLSLTVVVAKWTAEAVHHRGIYLEQIIAAGYPYLDKEEEYVHPTKVEEIMTRDPQPIMADQTTLAELETLLQESKVDGFPVVQDGPSGQQSDRRVVGYMTRFDISEGLDRARREDVPFSRLARLTSSPVAADGSPILLSGSNLDSAQLSVRATLQADEMFDLRPFMTSAPILVPADQPVETTYEIFLRLGIRSVLVERHGTFVGLVTKKDLIKHVLSADGLPLTGLKF